MINFIQKWLKILINELKINPSQSFSPKLPNPSKDSFSLRIARLLNLLNAPLFFMGIIFGFWLIIDFFLKIYLNPLAYQQISSISNPLINIIGPAAVGYGTNWLAIKMLFYPRSRNAVWQGLIPARRDELVTILSAGISQTLISPEIVYRYLKQSSLVAKLTSATINVSSNSDFRNELKIILRALMAQLVTAPATQKAVYEITGKAISTWRAENLLEMPIELTKHIWGPRVQQKIAESLPVLPEALNESFRELDAWLDRLPDLITQKQLAFEKILALISKEAVRLLDVPKIIQQQLQFMDEAELENLLTGNVSAELVFIQTSGGIFGLAIALAIYYPFLRLLLLGLIIGLYFVYQKTKSSVSKK